MLVTLSFFFFFSVLLTSQFSINTLFIGLMLLLFCILVFLVFCSLNMTWYGLLFFLVYVGGLLVLFFYVLSINSNPLA
uniref:NADH dehydrogenase subunit 6 n=1 Tax=Bdellocephala punctata TaxID=2755129 RepID=A0A7D6W3I3_9PLAT|nr:NADH dehydrogenase subunit 6 [Bdellocephala punctata]